MQSNIHVERGGSLLDNLRRMLAPGGGAVGDGLRLAVINGLFLVAALAVAAVFSVVGRVIRWVVPIPVASPGIVVLGLSVIFALVVWYRYAARHGQLARASGRAAHPDRFGIVAAVPFAILALLLLASGAFGLAVSVAGFNFGGVGAAVGRLIFAVMFGLLAAGCVVVARFAARGR